MVTLEIIARFTVLGWQRSTAAADPRDLPFSVTEEIHHNDRHTQKKIHSLSSSHVSVEHVLETKLTPPSSTQIYGYYLTLKAQRAEETGSDSIHTILFLLLFWMNTLNWFLLKQNVFTSSWLVSSTNTWQSECSRLRLAAFFSHLKNNSIFYYSEECLYGPQKYLANSTIVV